MTDLRDPLQAAVFIAQAELVARDDALGGAARLRDWAKAARVSLSPLWDRGYVASCLPVAFIGDGRFEFAEPDDEDARAAVVLEVMAEDDETVVDLLAFDARKPGRWATLLQVGEVLGAANILNPATYFDGSPLRLFRTPLRWLRDGCGGAVVLQPDAAWRWLSDAAGAFAAEDVEHGRNIAALLGDHINPSRILAPLREAA